MDFLYGPVETLDAAEDFGRQPHLVAEYFDESAGTKADLIRNAGYGAYERIRYETA